MRNFLALVILFSVPAFASTSIIISKDGSKATVTLLAFSVNPDATAMFQALAQPEVDMNGKLTKHFDFKSSDGTPVFNIECVFSKLVKETGSCILVVQKSPYAEMDEANKRVKMELHSADAVAAASAFVAPSSGNEILRTSDNRLVVSGNPGTGDWFSISYGY